MKSFARFIQRNILYTLIEVFSLLVFLLASMAMLAMSMYY